MDHASDKIDHEDLELIVMSKFLLVQGSVMRNGRIILNKRVKKISEMRIRKYFLPIIFSAFPGILPCLRMSHCCHHEVYKPLQIHCHHPGMNSELVNHNRWLTCDHSMVWRNSC